MEPLGYIDSDVLCQLAGRRVERLGSRSRSPGKGRHSRHDRDHDHRYGEKPALERTYFYRPMPMDECYDRTEPHHPLSIYVEERGRFFHHPLDEADPYTGRLLTSCKWSGRHDYRGYDDMLSEQYMGGDYQDQTDSGFGESELCREYNHTCQQDPYQL